MPAVLRSLSAFPSRALAIAALLVALLTPGTLAAQLRRDTGPISPPPFALAAPDDALAVDWNPAALGFLRTWSVVYAGAAGPENDALAQSGHAFYAATPLLFGISIGAGAWSRALPGGGTLGAGSLALAWAPDAYWSFGADLRLLAQPAGGLGSLDGALTLDLAGTWRPSPTLAISVFARDLASPSYTLASLGSVPRSFVLATAIRPFATQALTLDVAGALDTDGRVGIHGAASIRVPSVGELIASIEANDLGGPEPDVVVAAGLRVQWDQLSVAGGALLGPTAAGAPGAFWSARLEGATRPGLPRAGYVLELKMSVDTERQLVALVLNLDRALHDPRVVGVFLRGTSSTVPMAYAQELRMQITALRAAGKHVVCHLEAGTGGELYACAGADRTLVDPAGGVRLVGPSSDVLLLGDVLRNVGVRADFVRIGPFKSAVEQLQNRSSSGPALAERGALLDSVYARFVSDLAGDLHLSIAGAEAVVDAGPYLADEAVAAHIVDATADLHDIDAVLSDVMGGSYSRRQTFPDTAERSWGVAGRVGVLVIDGDIVDGENFDIPFIGIHGTGGDTATRAIDMMAADPSVRAIVLRVDSPGGSALASDRMWRALMRARLRKPVICSMGAVAASGGYFVAAAADEIWADPATITGSIGIFFGKVDFAPLAAQLGAGIESTGRGRHAGAESLYRPFTPEERALLAQKIRVLYRQFLSRVSAGRTASGHPMSATRVDALGRGRVYSGDDARRSGLVDHLGGLASAIARARTLGRLDDDSAVVVLPRRPSTLLDYVLGDTLAPRDATGASSLEPLDADALSAETRADVNGSSAALLALPAELRAVLGTVVAMQHVRAGGALARLPFDVTIR